ncbi:MAG TPA: hypothetical protein IAB26_12900 [Candidatus Limivivens merdigallinarum]|uniref:Uncharacterized protein n=1 Tax=Candidatus Limivivens merdigallinarum TaxID=2840859 RepID=A0A9D1D339_9FIRM|nr:hypothetical protein [Candidatus Limivivens merdigallinarum]
MKQERKRELGTFVVHVQHYENATWQGEVVWADKNITQRFRSALELLKLIDSALDPPKDDGLEVEHET